MQGSRGIRTPWTPPQEDDDDDDDDDEEEEEEEEEEGEDETVQPMDFDPLNSPKKKTTMILSHNPPPAPFFDKINYWPQLRPQYLLKQRELQLGRPSFRKNDCQ